MYLIALTLAIDCFAVSTILSLGKIKNKFLIPIHFGIFQGVITLIGYCLGYSFNNIIANIDHFTAFFLLLAIGSKMIVDSGEKKEIFSNFSYLTLLTLSIATSIDALAIGIALGY